MRLYTFDEFMRTEFPASDVNDDRFSGSLTIPDMLAYRIGHVPVKKCLFIHPESTAEIIQTQQMLDEDLKNGDTSKVLYLIAAKNTLTMLDVHRAMRLSGTDGFLLDLLTLKPEEREQVRQATKAANVPMQYFVAIPNRATTKAA